MTPTYAEARLWFNPEREVRFWHMVDKRPDGCWLWTGALTDTGHGQYRMFGGVVRVHRLTWILARERNIPEWMKIRHLICNRKPCCNPAHLVGGTTGENNSDRVLIHAAYDWDQEMQARSEYMRHPYIGHFNN